ncbi:uncharacterized protein F4807DRAFT_348668 [Annulohypoxylon truncatum]|uniref:uncharacterized protein n=1 Tax=Annulohypoxylon truncatum TaxID=327061 RepID=UPI00200758EC|nr:uncharacterized protein F4807DRAFT_348668 [Annulohypoxylon truncatum]KAI1212759.1 hypothetical protein F4807DRAFT_348668 [Annulohypoxylon truncatum]
MEFDGQDSGPIPLATSQASSHFPLLEPVSGAMLFELETARRAGLRRRGALKTGSAEIDESVLLGGFERGQVAGVSAEEAEFGVLVGLHTVAHATVFGAARKATIITTLAPAAILPMLRDVIRVQVQAKFGPAAAHRQQEVNAEVRRCLELISVSRVFDVEGLWEVISEIETPPSPSPPSPSVTASAKEERELGGGVSAMNEVPTLQISGSPRLSSQRPAEKVGSEAAPKIPILPSLRSPPRIERTEVGDSEDDEDEELSLSSSSSPAQKLSTPSPRPPSSHPPIPSAPSPSPPAAPTTSSPTKAPTPTNKQEEPSHIPDIILITHFSTLLTNLFTRSADNKTGAHTTLQLLSSHLRYLSRSAAGPLIMLLNTTSTTSTSSYSSTTTTPNAPHPHTTTASKTRSLEPTLRSIFNSGPAKRGGGDGNARRHTYTTKPAFGATFAQFLDLHLLCTRIPRTRSDAETLFAPGGDSNNNSNTSIGAGEARYSWVVEVLLDELGVWEWDNNDDGNDDGGDEMDKKDGAMTTWTRRRSREQRWGAVDVRSGVRLVDASFRRATRIQGPVRLAAGFGGPPSRGL